MRVIKAFMVSAKVFWVVSMIYYLVLIGYESYYQDYSQIGRYTLNGLIAVGMHQIFKDK